MGTRRPLYLFLGWFRYATHARASIKRRRAPVMLAVLMAESPYYTNIQNFRWGGYLYIIARPSYGPPSVREFERAANTTHLESARATSAAKRVLVIDRTIVRKRLRR